VAGKAWLCLLVQMSLLCGKHLCGGASSALANDSENGTGGIAGREEASKDYQWNEQCELSPIKLSWARRRRVPGKGVKPVHIMALDPHSCQV